MKKGQTQRASAKGVKAEADRRFRGVAEQASLYKGRCLFPVDANGGLCLKSPSRCHVIPRSSVLDLLKDPKSGKVLDLDWGVDQWAALILKSDEDHPVNLEDPTTFELRDVGTREACTGLYACQTHDAVFKRIDIGSPDFSNPYVRWLTMGRIAMYAADLCYRRKFLVDTWKWQTLRGGNRALRSNWLRESQFAYTAYEKAHLAARFWGESWRSLKNRDDLSDGLVDSSGETFRSRLRMAACVYYGQATAVVVLPKEGDEHTMALLHWSEDRGRVVDDQKRLIDKAQNTKATSDYGIDFFIELMAGGSGAVAASPESFRELPIVQRMEVQKVVMRGLQATGIDQALRENRPGYGPDGKRRYRGRTV